MYKVFLDKNYIMNKYISLFFALLISYSLFANDWGQNGHRTVGEIASAYLTKKTKKKLLLLLEGESLAKVSTYADEIKSEKSFNNYNTWHYVNIPFNKNYDEIEKNLKGDIIVGIETCLEKISSTSIPKEERKFYTKMLIHLVGDMHQPMHLGLEEDKGGNDIKVKWFGKNSNLHRVWDTDMIESYHMSYTELSQNKVVFTKQEIQDISSGKLMDWVDETRVLTKKVYDSAKDGDNLGYRYSYDWFPVVQEQLHKAGIRLAVLLNEYLG